jgi:cytochrome c6
MKKVILLLVISMFLCSAGNAAFAEKAGSKNVGEMEFKEHCAVCHPDGGNIINPKKTLHAKDLEANKIKTAADIVKIMRKPGPGMTTFDEKAVTNKEAHELAEYILKTFK